MTSYLFAMSNAAVRENYTLFLLVMSQQIASVMSQHIDFTTNVSLKTDFRV